MWKTMLEDVRHPRPSDFPGSLGFSIMRLYALPVDDDSR